MLIFLSFFKLNLSFLKFFLTHFLSYTGSFEAKASIGISPLSSVLNQRDQLIVFVVLPITT